MPRWVYFVIALVLIGTVVAGVLFAISSVKRLAARVGEIAIPERPGIPSPPDVSSSCFEKIESGLGSSLNPEERTRPADAIAAVARRVEIIRGLKFSKPVEPKFLSTAEFSRRVSSDFSREFTAEESEVNSRLLVTLGAIPSGTDLRKLLAGALGSGVLGFYDNRTGELVVRQGEAGRALNPFEEVVLSHELTHALTDQVLKLPKEADDESEGSEDSSLAALAVVEGDASTVETLYSQIGLSSDEKEGLAEAQFAAVGEGGAGIFTLPHFVQRELAFPYVEGQAFVCDMISAGGWDRVNSTYAAPPKTTAAVLFPDDVATDEAAVDPSDPSALDEPWKRERKFALGAADLQFLLEAPGGGIGRAIDDAEAAAEALAGGEVELWSSGKQSAAGMSLAQRPGQRGLCEAVRSWYRKSFPTGRDQDLQGSERLAVDGVGEDAALSCSGNEVKLGIAPDLATARQLIAS
jgi:hypothetical protein